MMIFIFFIVFSFVPFLNADIEFLKYISYLSYFDPVGLLYKEVEVLPSLLISSGMLVLSSVFTYLMTTRKYVHADFL